MLGIFEEFIPHSQAAIDTATRPPMPPLDMTRMPHLDTRKSKLFHFSTHYCHHLFCLNHYMTIVLVQRFPIDWR